MYSSSYGLDIQFRREWQATMTIATSTLTADGSMGGWKQTLLREKTLHIVEIQGTCLELEGAERNGRRLMWLWGGRRPSSQ